MAKTENLHREWWEGGVAYQIYLRSFYDTNGDGVGDLRGVTDKLDYLAGNEESLGVNAIWLSPFYPSPMVDFGYDVADYCGVDPAFGAMADFDEMLKAAHQRGIKVITDFIPNHTSDQHPWFLESKSSKQNPKRDWYVWRDGKAKQPPNNWISSFGGSAWELDKASGQYYLHTFLKQQPDLNWDNPEVRQAMLASMRFWLDKGVDGFRVDAVNWLSKNRHFKDDPPNPDFKSKDEPYYKLLHHFSREGPNLFTYLKEMVDLCSGYGGRFIITEAYPDSDDGQNYYSNYYKHLHTNICAPFNFETIESPWDARSYRTFVNRLQNSLLDDQIPIYVMGNHDKPRLASRLGRQTARSAALLLLTLPGLPFIYYGEELGMLDVDVEPGTVMDPYSTPKAAGRPRSRTPMQWSAHKNGGFTAGEPWLPLAKDFGDYNVATEADDPESFLNLYKTLVSLRRNTPAIKYGDYARADLGKQAFGFYRQSSQARYLIAVNFSGQQLQLNSDKLRGRVLLSSYLDRLDLKLLNGGLSLRPHEGVVISDAS